MRYENFIPIVHNREITETITPKLRYDGNRFFSCWQEQAENKLKELLGLETFQKCDDCMEIEYDIVRSGYREIRFHFQSEEGYFVPCHLLIPKGDRNRRSPCGLPPGAFEGNAHLFGQTEI